MYKPLIGITMGEPAGIGPEISIKALTCRSIYGICQPFIYGDMGVLKQIFAIAKGIRRKNRFTIKPYTHINDIKFKFGEIAVIDFNNVKVDKLVFSRDSAMGGRVAGEYIQRSINDAMNKKIDAVVTAPISKVSFKLGGWGLKYAGHTEMFAAMTKTDNYAMLLCHGGFRALHVTTHIPLKEIPRQVTKKRVLATIMLAVQACRLFGIQKPRIAVCGLNPHSGESGKMGQEEIKIIIPAIEAARKLNGHCQIDGPLPPDTAWCKVAGGIYDIGIAMYHDQGHIPTKLLGFSYNQDGSFKSIKGINVTLGIPVVRVSVDHGVAYGKAGKGIASSESILEAIRTAAIIANKAK